METTAEQFDKAVDVFVDSIENYFQTITGIKVTTSPPYVKDPEELLLRECTAMIGVSGNKKGLVYISGDLALYEEFIETHIGLAHPTERHMLDMAGEISNVIAGNVREVFGKEFMISVPIVFKGKPEVLQFPEDVPIYVLPFQWKTHQAYMVVGLI